MNFEFSPEQLQLRDVARRFLEERSPSSAVRAVMEGDAAYDKALWAGFAEMGFLGVTIPEEFGGLGLGYLELCVLAEEVGRSLAPVPFSSSVYLATEFLLAAGDDAQKACCLRELASGKLIGTFSGGKGVTVRNGALEGSCWPVADGSVADFAVIAAEGEGGLSLHMVDLSLPGVTRTTLETIDPSRNHARLDFAGVSAQPLGNHKADAASLISTVLDKAAVLTAFEQVGGADRALEMARDYALDRMAFGRPIGSFQAIKHMLADMYVSATLARSNAYYGAWALSTGDAELPAAAAAARVSATKAFQHCAKNDIQVHGGMGFTWAFDCHLYYRRANLLALNLGSLSEWEDKLISRLQSRNAA